MSKKLIVGSFLTDEQEFQRMQAEDLQRVAMNAGYEIEICFAENNAVVQIHQLFKYIHRPEDERPLAIIVETVAGDGLARVACNAAKAGISWILINCKVDYIDLLHRDFPNVAVASVGTNQKEVGRIQGMQFVTLLPNGGRVLYIQGPPDTSVAQERLNGAREVVGDAGIELNILNGDWTENSAETSVANWCRLESTLSSPPALVGAQNDSMAVGAKRAIAKIRAEWAHLPYTGCDGLPSGGQRLVKEGILAATVITPSNAGPAFEIVHHAITTGTFPKQPVSLSPSSFPPESELAKSVRKRP
jgi:ribose transport system substrate-binding protein